MIPTPVGIRRREKKYLLLHPPILALRKSTDQHGDSRLSEHVWGLAERHCRRRRRYLRFPCPWQEKCRQCRHPVPENSYRLNESTGNSNCLVLLCHQFNLFVRSLAKHHTVTTALWERGSITDLDSIL